MSTSSKKRLRHRHPAVISTWWRKLLVVLLRIQGHQLWQSLKTRTQLGAGDSTLKLYPRNLAAASTGISTMEAGWFGGSFQDLLREASAGVLGCHSNEQAGCLSLFRSRASAYGPSFPCDEAYYAGPESDKEYPVSFSRGCQFEEEDSDNMTRYTYSC